MREEISEPKVKNLSAGAMRLAIAIDEPYGPNGPSSFLPDTEEIAAIIDAHVASLLDAIQELLRGINSESVRMAQAALAEWEGK